MDQCEYCIVRGEVTECEDTNCNIHESWYVKHLNKEIKRLEDKIKEMQYAQDVYIMTKLDSLKTIYNVLGEHIENEPTM